MRIPYYKCRKCGEMVHAAKRIHHLRKSHPEIGAAIPFWKPDDKDWLTKLLQGRKIVNEWFGEPIQYSTVQTPTSARWERASRRHGKVFVIR